MSLGYINDGIKVQKYVYDFDVDGGAVSSIVLSDKSNYDPLSIGSIVTDFLFHVVTAFTTGASGTLSLGHSSTVDGYMVATAAASLSANSVWRPGTTTGSLLWDDTNDNMEAVYVSSAATGACVAAIATGAMTAGKGYMYLSHIKSV